MKALLISTDCAQNEYRKLHNAYGGVTYYRLIGPQKAVNALGHDWQYYGNNLYTGDMANFNKFFANFDIVISKHIDNPSGAKSVQLACQKNNIPLVYDLDDDLFSIREDNPAHESYAKGNMKRVYLATNLSFADAFFVSTEPLKETYGNFYKQNFGLDVPIHVLPNFIDPDLFEFKSPKNEDKVMIGYHGSITHDTDLAMVLPVIDRIMSEHKDVYMQLVGTVRRDSINKLFDGIKNRNRFEIKAGTPAYDTFPEYIMGMQWDIGVAPLVDDQFNRCKSHIKYLEYTMKGIPTIASAVYPYSENAKEAILCRNEHEWYQKLKQMVQNKKLRHDTARKAREHVMGDCQYKDHGQLWVDAAQSVINNHTK